MSFFVPNPRGIDAILNSDETQAAMMKVAEAGKSYAESISPVDSGAYKGSFKVEPATFPNLKRGGTRKGAVIVNTAEHAAAVEWGQDRHILGQTIAKIEGDNK